MRRHRPRAVAAAALAVALSGCWHQAGGGHATSIGGGRLVVAWSPGLYGSTDTGIMAFGPATD